MLNPNDRIRLSPNFCLDEFLDPTTYEDVAIGKEKELQELIQNDPNAFYNTLFANTEYPIEYGVKLLKLVVVAQFTRDRYDRSVTINNWGTGGDLVNSGFRSPKCKIGAPLSKHKKMEAIDAKVSNKKESEIYTDVITNQKEWLDAGVTEIEQGTYDAKTGEGWSHLATPELGLSRIHIIPFWNKPK
jgi:hypothetical protein